MKWKAGESRLVSLQIGGQEEYSVLSIRCSVLSIQLGTEASSQYPTFRSLHGMMEFRIMRHLINL